MGELRQAVARGDLEQDVLQLAKRGIEVGGNVTGSVLIDGDNNIVLVGQNQAVPATVFAVDERALLAQSIAEFRDEQVWQRQAVSDSPYPGLFAYSLQDALHFFGREQAVADLMLELKQKRVIWLHGRSGTGKSSFIQAGLLPALLDNGAFPVLLRPFDEFPTTTLEKELFRRHWSTELDLAKESLLQFLGEVNEYLHGQEIYVFFDQFEEFFIHLSEQLQKDFARQLADCAADARLPVHFVFSLRSDYFGETVILRERLQPAIHREYVLHRLSPEQARDVIVQPLLQCGISYADGLVDAILDHLEGAKIESPQLQLVCERLFRTLPEGSKQITFQQYKDLDYAKGILNAYLKQALNDQQLIPADQQKAAVYLLTTLVTADGRRDAKRPSDWYEDQRIHPWTLNWYADRGKLPFADRALGMESIRHIAFADYILKIGDHVTFQRDELEQLIKTWEGPILDEYIRHLQNTFVDQVILSLRGARLIHEIQSVDGQLAYELIHDYLISEIQGWLDEDEQKARELRSMLDQRQFQFKQHGLLLDSKELDIISAELENPKFTTTEADQRLILFSAAVYGDAKRWLAFCGPKALDWLREAYQEENYAESLRQGAVASLGETDDEETFNQLYKTIQQKESLSSHNIWVGLLAHYLKRSLKDHRLSGSVNWGVLFPLAKLRIKDGAEQRRRMRLVSVLVFLVSDIIVFGTVLIKNTRDHKGTEPLSYIFLLILGSLVAFIFGEVMTSLGLILRGKGSIWRVPVLTGIGSILGVGLFTLLTGQWLMLWFAGGVIGLALSLFPDRWGGKGKPGSPHLISYSMIAATLVFVVSMVILDRLAVTNRDLLLFAGAAFSAALFTGTYIYLARRNRSL